MTGPLEPDEIGYRLAAIMEGPWTSEAAHAMAFMRPALSFGPVLGVPTIPLAGMQPLLSRRDAAREPALAHVLRPHWRDRRGIQNQREIAIRKSLDEALTGLQLMELAVEMGFLPEEDIREVARTRLTELLWSTAARAFVRDYDYLSVGYLATRVDVDIGQGSLVPPPVKPDGAVRFATLLSEHTRWYRDRSIRTWLDFMDDYVVLKGEQQRFEQFLLEGREIEAGSERAERERFLELATGAEQFVLRLSTIMDVLHEGEQGRVGLLYSYWLAKFFGYDLGAEGYRQVRAGWSEAVIAGVMERSDDPAVMTARRDAFRERVASLRQAWDAVQELERELRVASPANVPAASDEEPVWIQIPDVSEPDCRFFIGEPALVQPEDEALPLAAASPSGGTVWNMLRKLEVTGFSRQGRQPDDARKYVGTIPAPNVRDYVDYLVRRAETDGSIKLGFVNAKGNVKRHVIEVPKGSAMLDASLILGEIDKVKF